MPNFLRSPQGSEPKDGDTFIEVLEGEVIVQIARKKGDSVECLEARVPLDRENKEKSVEEAKKRALALYNKKEEVSKKKRR